jgi:hypothetical protein
MARKAFPWQGVAAFVAALAALLAALYPYVRTAVYLHVR